MLRFGHHGAVWLPCRIARCYNVHGVAAVKSLRVFSTSSDNTSEIHVSRSRTATTERLWRMRLLRANSPQITRSDGSRTPRESLLEIDLDFQGDKVLAGQYENYRGGVRLGKILEDLDACAGNCSRLHCDPTISRPGLAIVTASVDQIHVLDRLSLDKNYVMRGVVTWVGSSSLEVSVSILDKDDRSHDLLSAYFLMVVRGEDGKSAKAPPLLPETDEEKEKFKSGLARKEFRRQEAATSLYVSPPTQSEVELLHSMFSRKSGNNNKDVNMKKWVPLSSTQRQSIVLCEPQERNTNNRIFGGYLMQKAYELAYATLIRVTGSKAPVLLGVDDISFIHPVEIASIITFKSKVVCSTDVSNGVSYSVRVTTDVFDIKTSEEKRCNILHFAFGCTSDSSPALPHIRPRLYTEALLFLDGRRRLENLGEQLTKAGSSLCSLGLIVPPRK